MKKWILAILALLFVTTNTWAVSNTDLNHAQSLIEDWFSAMKSENYGKASSYLAPQFLSIHTDGITRNKEEEMELIKNLHMRDYHLSNFDFTTSGDVIVVTFKDQGEEKIDDKEISNKTASRMAVLQKQKGKWLILAYSNLDKIG